MGKTPIDWATHSINPIKGLCPMNCLDLENEPYCYARKKYLNPFFKSMYEHPEIRFTPETTIKELNQTKAGDRIFWGSTMELFGDWVKPEWREWILDCPKVYKDRTHIFLTKQPQNLPHYFPDNCWVLYSATNPDMFLNGLKYISKIDAKIKGVSIEPMLAWRKMPFNVWSLLNWTIIGSRTKPAKHPPLDDVRGIIEGCDENRTAVFVKEPLASYSGIMHQAYPNIGSSNSALKDQAPY